MGTGFVTYTNFSNGIIRNTGMVLLLKYFSFALNGNQ